MKLLAQDDVPSFHRTLIQVISKNSNTFWGVIETATSRFVYVNDPGLKMFEKEDASELIDIPGISLLNEPLSTEEKNTILDIAWEKGGWQNEREFLTQSGKTFWGKIAITPFSFEEKGHFLIQIEKTERAKLSKDKLAEEKQLSGAFVDYASMGIVIANVEGIIVRINPFALQLFGYEGKDILGQFIEILLPARVHEKHINHRNRFASHPQNRPMGTGMDLFAVRKDGVEFPVEVSLGTYSVDDERFVIAFISDITIRKSAELEVKKLNDELEFKVEERTRQLTEVLRKLETSEIELKKLLEKEKDLSELKTRFVSMASHEFRTPLSTILSSTYLLEKYITTEEQPKRDKHIERIISSVNMLTDILNDFLSVGKIEEGKIVVKPSAFNLSETILAIIEDINNIRKSGQNIHYTHTGDEIVVCDLSLLKHIVINLIANAIKFSTENKLIEVASKTQNGQLQLKVKDHGIGISKEDQEHLYERFFRGTNATNIQGTGLGLHIVSRYMELLDGEISCSSEIGKGTEFTIHFQITHGAIE